MPNVDSFSTVVNLFLMSRSTELRSYPTESFASCHFPMTWSCIFWDIPRPGLKMQRNTKLLGLFSVVQFPVSDCAHDTAQTRTRGNICTFHENWTWLRALIEAGPLQPSNSRHNMQMICSPHFVPPKSDCLWFQSEEVAKKASGTTDIVQSKELRSCLESSTRTTGSRVAQ